MKKFLTFSRTIPVTMPNRFSSMSFDNQCNGIKYKNGEIKNMVQLANTQISVVKGDLTEEETDIIVNAANEKLIHGGGVARHILKKGGSEIYRESEKIIQKQGEVKTGTAAITPAGKLKCKYVIHAVGPIYRDGKQGEYQMLASCIRNSLELATKYHAESISFPAISSGIFGFPKEECAMIFMEQIEKYVERMQLVHKSIFNKANNSNNNNSNNDKTSNDQSNIDRKSAAINESTSEKSNLENKLGSENSLKNEHKINKANDNDSSPLIKKPAQMDNQVGNEKFTSESSEIERGLKHENNVPSNDKSNDSQIHTIKSNDSNSKVTNKTNDSPTKAIKFIRLINIDTETSNIFDEAMSLYFKGKK